MSFFETFTAAFLSGAAGAMGLGGGGVLLIWLTAVGVAQLTARGINLLFFIPSAVIALVIHIKNGLVDFKRVLPAAASGLFGAVLGVWLSNNIDTGISGKMFALFLVIIGGREVVHAFKTPKEKN